MSILDNIGKTISDVSQGAIQKGKGMADIVKFNSLITEEEKKITGIYEQIGRQYVEEFGATPAQSMVNFIETLHMSQKNIADYQKKIKELKGVMQCPSCGAEIVNGVSFCTICGAKIEPEIEPETETIDSSGNIRCSSCGNAIPAGSKFCIFCGEQIEKA